MQVIMPLLFSLIKNQSKNISNIKKKLHKQQVQKLLGGKKAISWHISEGVDFTTKSEEVIKIQKNWYAVIDSKLKLEKTTFDIFTNALKKGVVHRSEGENGVKLLDDKIELKIDQDSRLYPSKVYLNGDKHLIIFDKEGNHNAIKDADGYTLIEVGDASDLIGESSTFEMPFQELENVVPMGFSNRHELRKN